MRCIESGASFVYISDLMRATVGLRMEIGDARDLKVEAHAEPRARPRSPVPRRRRHQLAGHQVLGYSDAHIQLAHRSRSPLRGRGDAATRRAPRPARVKGNGQRIKGRPRAIARAWSSISRTCPGTPLEAEEARVIQPAREAVRSAADDRREGHHGRLPERGQDLSQRVQRVAARRASTSACTRAAR